MLRARGVIGSRAHVLQALVRTLGGRDSVSDGGLGSHGVKNHNDRTGKWLEG